MSSAHAIDGVPPGDQWLNATPRHDYISRRVSSAMTRTVGAPSGAEWVSLSIALLGTVFCKPLDDIVIAEAFCPVQRRSAVIVTRVN
jgi:hypothetical protein